MACSSTCTPARPRHVVPNLLQWVLGLVHFSVDDARKRAFAGVAPPNPASEGALPRTSYPPPNCPNHSLWSGSGNEPFLDWRTSAGTPSHQLWGRRNCTGVLNCCWKISLHQHRPPNAPCLGPGTWPQAQPGAKILMQNGHIRGGGGGAGWSSISCTSRSWR